MQYNQIVKRAWEFMWRYRALWLFGAILALTTFSGFFFLADLDTEESWKGVEVRVADDGTLYLPGEGLTIDLRGPGWPVVEVEDWDTIDEALVREFFTWNYWSTEIPEGVWAIAIATGIVVAGMILIGLIGRYVAETGLIRMVNHSEETGEKLGLRRGLRLGFSRAAWRLFLIDLLTFLVKAIVLLSLLAAALSPLFLWKTSSEAAGIAGTVTAAGLFVLWVLLSIVVGGVLNLFLQVIRRACAVDGLGALASIRRGLSVVRRNLKEVAATWLIWIGTRLAWVLLAIPAIVITVPAILLAVVVGGVVGGIPTVLTGGFLTLFLEGAYPWIVGAIVGLPFFLLILLSPMLFLGGLVEVFKSSTWTLAYRELSARESVEAVEKPGADTPRLEAAPATQ